MQQFFAKESLAPGSLHLWAGPIGVHLFWPDFRHSRIDFCANWKEEEDPESVECGIEELIGDTSRAQRLVDRVKPKHLAPAFALAGLAGATLPMIQEALRSSGTLT